MLRRFAFLLFAFLLSLDGLAWDAPKPPADAKSGPGLAHAAQKGVNWLYASADAQLKLNQLARYIPSGKKARVTMSFRVHNDAGGNPHVWVVEQLYPYPVTEGLRSKNATYKQEVYEVHGTGIYSTEGAPEFPNTINFREEFPDEAKLTNKQRQKRILGWMEWQTWRQKRETWDAKQQEQKPAAEWKKLKPKDLFYDPELTRKQKAVLAKIGEELKHRPNPNLQRIHDNLSVGLMATTGDPFAQVEPGGVLFERERSALLAGKLSIESVALDEKTGILTIGGKRTTVGLDLDLLATALRLVYEGGWEPYFSLDPIETDRRAEFSRERDFENEIEERLKSDPAFRKRFLEVSQRFVDHEGDPHRVAYVDQLDKKLATRIDRSIPREQRVVFHPDWLRETRFGEILFHADVLLKGASNGCSAYEYCWIRVKDGVKPRFWAEDESLALPGWEEIKGRKIRPDYGGRLWFLPGGTRRSGSGLLDLSDVQPSVNLIGQYQYQDIDEPLSPWDQSYKLDVRSDFDKYAVAMPPWEELRQAFRAYILALWIKDQAPNIGGELRRNLPAPRRPAKTLPETFIDMRIVAVKAKEGESTDDVKLRSVNIRGGIGFRLSDLNSQELMRDEEAALRTELTDNHTGSIGRLGDGEFIRLAIPGLTTASGTGAAIRLDKNRDLPTSMEGYADFRNRRMAESGWGPYWLWYRLGWIWLPITVLLSLIVGFFVAGADEEHMTQPDHPNRLGDVYLIFEALLVVLFGFLFASWIQQQSLAFEFSWRHISSNWPWVVLTVWSMIFIWTNLVSEEDDFGEMLVWGGLCCVIIAVGLYIQESFALFQFDLKRGKLMLLGLSPLGGFLRTAAICIMGIVIVFVMRSGFKKWFRKSKCQRRHVIYLAATVAFFALAGFNWDAFVGAWSVNDAPLSPPMALFNEPLGKEALYARMAATEGLSLSSTTDPRHGFYIPAVALAIVTLILGRLSWIGNDRRSTDSKDG